MGGPNLEGIIPDGPENVREKNLRRESVAVVDDGLLIGTIPAVEFHAATAFAQSPAGGGDSWARTL